MKKRHSYFSICCVVFFLLFSVFMAWYLPSMSSVRSKADETRRNLETSIGREGKQQDEYDRAVAELPLVLEELKEKEPLAEEAEQTVANLKARKKELAAEKKKLEAEGNPGSANPENSSGDEVTSNE